MGYALIVGGGTDGRYTISLDIGEAERAALVARFTTAQAAAQDKLAAAQAELNTKTVELDAATTAYNEATILYIEVLRNEAEIEGDEAYLEIVKGHAEAQAAYIRARAAHSAALANRNALSFSASHLTKALSAWQAQVLTETRQAWCTDYTEDATGYVATMEIPGESDLILIAPGGRSPVLATDGHLRSRGLMSPWQAYFNAAVLPGWQKFKPTYRWGTITALDVDADTATVSLAEARSSAQRLLVNQAPTLANVPVVYMTCNAGAFEVGDRVVVEFQGQDWAAPRVIGFLDNPKSCLFVCMGTTNTGTGLHFSCRDEQLIDYLSSESVDIRVRIDNRDWESMRFRDSTAYSYSYEADFPIEAYYGDAFYCSSAIIVTIVHTPYGSVLSAPPFIGISVLPPVAQNSNVSARSICEFVIYKNGQIIFNAAVNDDGYAGYPARNDRRTKNRSGIRIEAPFYGPVGVLDYVLTAT